MPPRITRAEERLMAAYREAALRINRQLQDASDPRQRRIILRRIDSLLEELDRLTQEWVEQELPLRFEEGSDEALRKLRTLRGFSGQLDETFGTLHTQAIEALAQDTTLKFSVALESVRREAGSAIQRATQQQIVNELIASEASGDSRASRRVKKILLDKGFASIRLRNRSVTVEDYASMLTHTVLADAHNTGAATRYLSNGVQFARIIEREDAPDKCCQWMRGKVVWLGDRRLLNPYHPWCMGGHEPVFGEPEGAIRSPEDPRVPAEVKKMLLKKR